ncbi:hypothetical protein ASPVEDRAFT_90094 [Aspergillus versicolor CBS 583.65]|uniref:Mid2 domain-containing protein n=1 Tax=Aspergillus versicolor CBS 583.65 TaxID=1036611 RepID=A0A1L9Q550_ASPVE|nr:uncharacterized protein ASPVEDRAFT_90094 [Aspergillus versicolor CBS 583.65]OJJ08887.1 hypothetical protein ASPVEDRAFT_90094 [Aspergillus versicolor CBS 583.65]
MLLSAFKALYLVLPLASGLSIPLPEPTQSTVSSSNPSPPPPAPQTTPSPQLKHRRDATTVTHRLTDRASICGWQDAVNDGYPVSCDPGSTCAYQRPNTKYPGMLACCEEGLGYCGFYSTCINLSQVSATPSIAVPSQPLAIYCTDATAPACVTWFYSDISVTDFGCSMESTAMDMYTSADASATTSGTVDHYELYLTQVGPEVVDSYLSTYGTDSVENNKATNAPTSTQSPSSAANSDTKSKNTGAIAGGVVGGVAGLALIGAAGFFVGRKFNNSKKSQGAEGVGANDDKGPYVSVPESHSPYSVNETQFASEMGTDETRQQVSEVDGSAPADRVYEMQETTVKDTEGKNFTAELPADSVFPAKK